MHVHADDTELARDGFLARAAEGIEAFPDLDVTKPDASQKLAQLSLRESACNSTRPERDVAPDRLRELARHHDVCV